MDMDAVRNSNLRRQGYCGGQGMGRQSNPMVLILPSPRTIAFAAVGGGHNQAHQPTNAWTAACRSYCNRIGLHTEAGNGMDVYCRFAGSNTKPPASLPFGALFSSPV